MKVRLDKTFRQALEEDYDAEDLEDFLRSSRIFREICIKALTTNIEYGIIGGDNVQTFKEENPLAVLAHKAGYREGLRHAIKLLRPEVDK